MLQLILSLFVALAVSSHDAWVKKIFSDLNPYQMAADPIFYSIPLFTISLFFIEIPPLDNAFTGIFRPVFRLTGLALSFICEPSRDGFWELL